MNWERRLRDIVLASGSLAAACGSNANGGLNFCCNAARDPCCTYLHCGAPITPECSAELACQVEGGTYTFPGCSFPGDAPSGDGDAEGAPGDANAADGRD